MEVDPRDSMAWEMLARTELAVADYDRCSATLSAWDKAAPSRPPVIDDLRGDMANARKDFGAAERYWRLYVAARPKAAQSLEKLADLCAGALGRDLSPERAVYSVSFVTTNTADPW